MSERDNEVARKANGKARMCDALGIITASEWVELRERYNNKCLCCGTTEDLEADHVVPFAVGGTNTIDNIQPLCATCNRHKHTQAVDFRTTPPTVMSIGRRSKLSRFTPEDILMIRREGQSREARREIAGRFGVTIPTIENIVSGKSWKYTK